MSSTNGTVLTHAFKQWSSRPADQRFSSLEALHNAVRGYADISVEAPNVDIRKLSVRVKDNAPVLIGSSGGEADFTHYSFGQLARRIGAPADYLRALPAALAVENINHGLATSERGENGENLLLARNGGLQLRGMVTTKYTRIWNHDITSRLMRLVQQSPEWQPAPAAFDGSRGLYASDCDMFAFLVDNDRRIFESGPAGGLGRGFFVWNSEVGASSFGLMTFYYEYVCGNHRVWGAKGVAELRIPHIGNADERAFDRLAIELRKYADSSAKDDEAKVQSMRLKTLGATKDEVLDAVFGLKGVDLSRKMITAGYEKAIEREAWYGDPNSVWGFTGGLTEVARDIPNAADRVKVEKAAGKIMQIAF